MNTAKSVFKGIVTRFAGGGGEYANVDQSQQKIVSFKAVGSGKPLTDDQLAKINRFAPKPLTAGEVYYRPVLLAHNGIDRDNERFHEDLLDSYAKSIVGKGFFVEGHPGWRNNGPGKGRIFDAHAEVMTPEKFLEITGETLSLPDGVATGKVLIVDFYMLKLESNADVQANIDGGIYCFASIGFTAPLFAVTDERGNEIYGEYRPKGEALEGSLVWLGAQPGAGAMKGAKPHDAAQSADATGGPQKPEEHSKGDMTPMEKQLVIIGSKLGRTFTVEKFADEIVALFGEKDAAIKDLTDKMTALQLAADDGKGYRQRLVEDTVKAGVLLGDIKNDEASQKAETDFLMNVPISRLEAMAGKATAQAKKQFPDKYEIPAGDQTDRDKHNADTQQSAGGGGDKGSLSEEAKKRADAEKK